MFADHKQFVVFAIMINFMVRKFFKRQIMHVGKHAFFDCEKVLENRHVHDHDRDDSK
jgi:hypothetical protein